MTQFQIDLTVTILDVLSFASVTTDLYGHRIELAEKNLRDPNNQKLLGNLLDVAGMPGSAVILYLYRKYPLKHILLWQGALLFLLARGISLYFAYIQP